MHACARTHRSLNVHVSGAIAVWEYARQGLVRAEP